jgi:hypothetical protein
MSGRTAPKKGPQMATIANATRHKSAKDALLESVDRAIDSAAEKMSRKDFKKAAKEFNEVLDRAASSRRRNRETA